jgi:peptide deformylase
LLDSTLDPPKELFVVLDVLAFPNPYLRKRAEPVTEFGDDLQRIVHNMEETMADRDGLGLAATQVGLDLRLLVLDPYAFEGDDGLGKPNVVIINPQVVWESDVKITAEEGCLSFPGVFIQVERPESVTIRAQDAAGATFELSGSKLGARALLHEIDHLNGVVMIDHVSHFSRQRALKKHNRNQKVLAEPPERDASRKGFRRKKR